jgi:hypothetical protein
MLERILSQYAVPYLYTIPFPPQALRVSFDPYAAQPLMPDKMPVADFEIFREQLAINHHAYGHALWEPRPWQPDRPVEVGDVGFIRSGRFHSLFNALRPAEGQSRVPEDYEQLVPEFSDHITESPLSSNHYCSAGINVEPESEYHSFR